MPKGSSTYQALNRAVGKALHRYDMLRDGDRIVVGLSGGADSLTMMWMLNERLQRIPLNFELFAVYIDPGFAGGFSESLQHYSAAAGFSLRVEETDYGILGHSSVNRENPCFLCARLRRKRLFEIAAELKCNKLALSTMVPSQTMFEGRFTVIRPLAHADEKLIRAFAREQNFPVFENPCPSAGHTKRQEIKLMLNRLYRSNPKIKGNIFRAMSRVKADYLLK